MKIRGNPIVPIVLVRGAQVSLLALAVPILLRRQVSIPFLFWDGVVVCAVLSLYFLFVFDARRTWGLPILTHLSGEEKVVALTFDDGPSPDTTPLVLDALQRHGVAATFFVLGDAAMRHPDLVRRIVAEGHVLGVHGVTHRAMALSSWTAFDREIAGALAAVAKACPDCRSPRYYRPPYGFKTAAMPFLLKRFGLCMAAWSIDSHDYRTGEPGKIATEVLRALHPGAIVLLHDGPGRTGTAAALPGLLSGLAEQGYRCAALSGAKECGEQYE